MADVTSEATLKVTTQGIDKAAADLKKVEGGLKKVEGQAKQTAGTLKAPIAPGGRGGGAGGGPSGLAQGRADHPVAAEVGDLIGKTLGNWVSGALLSAFSKNQAPVARAVVKQQQTIAKTIAPIQKAAETQALRTAASAGRAAVGLKELNQVFSPFVGLLPAAATGLVSAGTGLGLLGPAAIAAAAAAFALTKGFKAMSEAAKDALDNLASARKSALGLNVGAEQERLNTAGTALGIAIGDKLVKPIETSVNRAITNLRTADIGASLQKKLDYFGITLTELKKLEDKADRIDFGKVFGLAVSFREVLERNIEAAAGDPKKLEKLQADYKKYQDTIKEVFGQEFLDAMNKSSTNLLKAAQDWAAKLDEALPSIKREEASKNAGEFQLAVNKFDAVLKSLKTNIAEGSMPAATDAIGKWADNFLAVAQKLQPLGTFLTTKAFEWAGFQADIAKDIWSSEGRENLKTRFKRFWDELTESANQAWEWLRNNQGWKDLMAGANQGWADFKARNERAWGDLKAGANQGWDDFKGRNERAWADLMAGANQGWADFKARNERAWGDLMAGANQGWADFKGRTELAWADLKAGANQGWVDFKARNEEAWADLAAGASRGWEIIKATWDKVASYITATLSFAGGALTTFFTDLKQTIKTFLSNLTTPVPGSGLSKTAPNMPSGLPGVQDQSYRSEGDTTFSGARLQNAIVSGGTGGTDVNAVIDKALIRVDGSMQTIIRQASLTGQGTGTGAGTGDAASAGLGGLGSLGGIGGMAGFGGIRDLGGFQPNAAAIGSGAGVAPTGPATPGAPTNSRLSINPQARSGAQTIQGVDRRLQEILHAASSHLPPGYTAEIVGGMRAPGASGFHPKGMAADLRILKPDGTPIKHFGDDTTGLYTRFARAAYGEQLARYPELKGKFAWGGAFGTGSSTPNEKDLMHFDLGGERGRFTQNRLSTLGVLPGATFGGGRGPAVATPGSNWPTSTSGGVSGGAVAPPNPSAATAGLRNFNLGNLKYSGRSAGLYPGVVGPSINTDQGDRQIVFRSMDEGIRAAALLARRKFEGGRDTVNKLVAAQGGWTPGNTAAAANIARSMGVGPHDPINLNDPATMSRYLRAIATQEHGRAGAAISAERIGQALAGTPQALAKQVGGDNPITVPQVAAGAPAMSKSTVGAQAPTGASQAGAFKSSAEGEAFGKSAAESIRKGLEGTNIPVSGIPPTSRGVAPHTAPKPTGGDTPEI